jgi:hypothetical protein
LSASRISTAGSSNRLNAPELKVLECEKMSRRMRDSGENAGPRTGTGMTIALFPGVRWKSGYGAKVVVQSRHGAPGIILDQA